MIDPITIGAGLTIFALGAGGTWAVMRVRLAVASRLWRAYRSCAVELSADLLDEKSLTAANGRDLGVIYRAHARCADALATKQRILDDLADYLRGQKSGTAVKALRMIEERHL